MLVLFKFHFLETFKSFFSQLVEPIYNSIAGFLSGKAVCQHLYAHSKASRFFNSLQPLLIA
jgi:hypothetical protein